MELMYAEIIDGFVIMCHRIPDMVNETTYHYQAVTCGYIADVVIDDTYVDAKTAYETLLCNEY